MLLSQRNSSRHWDISVMGKQAGAGGRPSQRNSSRHWDISVMWKQAGAGGRPRGCQEFMVIVMKNSMILLAILAGIAVAVLGPLLALLLLYELTLPRLTPIIVLVCVSHRLWLLLHYQQVLAHTGCGSLEHSLLWLECPCVLRKCLQ